MPVLAGLLVIAWASPPTLPDSDGPPSLGYAAPAECPDVEELRARVDRLAPGVLEDSGLRARIDARVERVEGRYAASVRIEDRHGDSERQFASSDCELVGDATALIIAVALAPLTSAATIRELEREEPPAEPEPEPEPKRELEPEPEPELAPAETNEPGPTSINVSVEQPEAGQAKARVRVGLRLTGGGGLGPTTNGYAAVGGGLALFSGRWRAELVGAWSPPRVIRRGQAGGRFDAWILGARGCFVPKRRRLEFPLCPGLELGSVRGRGVDELPVVYEASFLWAALGVGQGLWFVPHPRVALGLEARAAVALRGGAFVVEDRQIARLVPVTVGGLAGIELRLP